MLSRFLLLPAAIVPSALHAFEISEFHISPERQVEIGLTADAESPEYRLEYLDGESWFENVHATLLHLLGFDHEQLAYRFQGRDFRLTDVHRKIVQEILA